MSERSKKVTYNVSLHRDGCATKAIKLVARVEGVSSVEINKTAQKLTVVGTFDPVDVVKKLRKKFSPVTIVSVEGAEKSGKVKEEPEKEESEKANLEKAGTSKEETTKDARKVLVEGAKRGKVMMKMMMEMKANLEKAGTSKEETTKYAKKVSVEGAQESGKMMMERKANLEKAGTSEEGPKKCDVGKFENVYVAYNPYLNEPYKVEFSDENPNACVIC
ncbi:heavy metal-associated isoprenylated plant protein 39-like [Corylus avellana]|uniref:heavy metal-associated isoprenylated plant protein 39-like n=1 Tax=Corylus avellana TaxID=13451 RepID=UPI001E20A7E6|nr:heavy metal-associated isoprenylated plant protein 39-like [Corylus avellana]